MWKIWKKLGYKLNLEIENNLEKLGFFIATHPLKFIIIGIIFITLGSLGLLKLNLVSSPSQLWSPIGSSVTKQKENFDNTFGPFYRLEQIIISSKIEGGDVIDKNIILEMYHLNELIYNISVTVNGKIYTLDDICARPYPGSACIRSTPMDYFYNSTINNWNYQEIINSNSTQLHEIMSSVSAKSPLNNPIQPNTVMGLISYSNVTPGFIEKAEAFMCTFLVSNYEANLTVNIAWENAFLSFMKNFSSYMIYSNMYYSADISLEEELASEIDGNELYIILSYIIVLIYVSISIGKLNILRSKLIVGFIGVLLVFASIVTGLGISSAFGVFFSPISIQVLPFLLLGTGIDDMFIISNSFDRMIESNTVNNDEISYSKIQLKMGKAMRHGGPHLFLTSLTDCVAFLFGALGKMPAVRSFCLQAAISVFCQLLLQIIIFVPVIVLNEYRVEANRIDCFPCAKLKKSSFEKYSWNKGNLINKFLEKYFLKFILHSKVKIAIIFIFAIILAIFIYGITLVKEGLGQISVIDPSSYLYSFLNAESQYFGDVGAPVYIIWGNFDYTNYTNQDIMNHIEEAIINDPWMLYPPLISWWDDFQNWLIIIKGYIKQGERIPPNNFYPWLNEFLFQENLIGPYYRGDIVFNSNGTIKASRIMSNSIGLNTTTQYVNAISSTINLLNSFNFPVYPYSIFYIYFDEYIVLKTETIQNLGLALLSVFIVSSIFIGLNIFAVLIEIFVISMIIIIVVGFLGFLDIHFNPLSAVNLIMSVGLNVEYTAHFVRSFMKHVGVSRDERVKSSLLDMGANVFGGGSSTFLAILMLGFVNIPVYRKYYFAIFLIMTFIGLLHGFFFLPVLLSLIGPKSFNELSETFNNKKKILKYKIQKNEQESIDINS